MGISSLTKKLTICLFLLPGFILSTSAALDMQTVTGSYWWVDGDESTSDGAGKIDPVSATVTERTLTAEFSAILADGQRVLRWTRYVGPNRSLPSSFQALLGSDGQNPLVWTKNDEYGSPVLLGLVTTWIKYKLAYAGGATTEQLFTNRITIADSATTKTGYTFAGSWTNSVGTSFSKGTVKTGSDFGIANHDDNAIVNLYPEWTANDYTVTLVDGEGATGGSGTVKATFDTVFPNVNVPVRPGYDFGGYYTEEDGKGAQYCGADGKGVRKWDIADERTLHALWTAKIRYYLTLHRNVAADDDVAISTIHTNGIPFRLPPHPWSIEGCTFRGWGKLPTLTVAEFNDAAELDGSDLGVVSDGQEVNLYAIWDRGSLDITFEENGGDRLPDSDRTRTVQAGFRYGFSGPFPVPTRAGHVFLGWWTDQSAGENITEDTTVTATGKQSLYAHWQDRRFYVAFDGNGATNMGAMAVQTFNGPDDEQNLPNNRFGRVGYTFRGWGETADATAVAYVDGQAVKGLASPGETKTLFALWQPILYTVVFDPNGGGVDAEMPALTCQYGQVYPLPTCTYSPRNPDLDTFGGWWDALNETTHGDGESFSNLCTTANATNVLKATWVLDVGDWSKHMHCTTLRWGMNDRGSATPKWEMMDGPQWGCTNTGSCVRQESGGSGTAAMAWLEAVVKTNGTLTFAYKLATNRSSFERNPWFCIGFSNGTSEFNADSVYDVSYQDIFVGNEWQSLTVPIVLASETSEVFIHIAYDFGEPDEYLCIDQVKWTPEGGDEPPVPGPDDAVEISSATVEGDAFKLSFTSDERFDYNLLTNANLLIDGWGVWGKKQGDGKVLLFEPTIQPGVPQMFYKVETIQRKK